MHGLESILRPDQVSDSKATQRVYQSDAYTVEKSKPEVVVFPESSSEVARIVRYCNLNEIPFTPRGAGTGKSGGAMPALGGVVISLKRMTRVIETNLKEKWMRVEAGAVNLRITDLVKSHGLHFAPDPSSQSVSTIGGNIAENSGGPHTLKYGVTAQHVLGMTMVTATGDTITMGGPCGFPPGYDLASLVIGSEGIIGIVTEAWIRLTPTPNYVKTVSLCFTETRQATETVSAIIASGASPAALEMMDRNVLVAVKAAFGLEFPEATQAMLIVECDGDRAEVDRQIDQVMDCALERGVAEIRVAQNEAERALLWKARKKGVGALGRLAPTLVTHDGVIPPSKLPEMLDFVYRASAEAGIGVANLFHAGDGNLHPVCFFDEREPGKVDAVVDLGEKIIAKCLELGGSVTGEHGIGVEKNSLLTMMYDTPSMALQKAARDIFHDNPLCNPCKIVPDNKSCVEHKMSWRGYSD